MVKPQIITMYLPQYHRIPENDEWWGEGFTEWTNVKKAKPLFEDHIQPRVPLNANYYDLDNPVELVKQMSLAKQYGISGFCFYHYWFRGGKKILEKPIEQLLNEKEIPLHFCLCWANESWTRNWDGVEGSKVTLIKQEYGNEDDWNRHFAYLLSFFKLEEYLKKDNCPVFLIYKPSQIPKLEMMLARWNILAKKHGFSGIHIIAVHRTCIDYVDGGLFSGVADFEPFTTLSFMSDEQLEDACYIKDGFNGKKYKVYDYQKIADYNCTQYKMKGINHYLGSFPGWDNTPRRGEDENVLKIINNTPNAFKEYLNIQYKKSMENENDYLFINAWNEWGEGAFLEPDEKYGYGFLESVKQVVFSEE